jgi:hypothetical protein
MELGRWNWDGDGDECWVLIEHQLENESRGGIIEAQWNRAV